MKNFKCYPDFSLLFVFRLKFSTLGHKVSTDWLWML